MEKFISSGRFMCKQSFIEKNPEENLLSDCTDVVHYVGGQYIQVLKSGEFYVDENFKSRSLDEAEIKLWENINKQMNDV